MVLRLNQMEQFLIAAGTKYVVGRHPCIGTGMGKALEDHDGFVKFHEDPGRRRVLARHIFRMDAATLIHEVIIAMKAGAGTVDNIVTAVHIHPALSEVVQRAAWDLRPPGIPPS